MEKFNPTYSLEEFKQSNFAITQTAYRTALDLGFNEGAIRETVSTMKHGHFYKSCSFM